MTNKINKVKYFFSRTVWSISMDDLSRTKGFILKVLRILLISLRGIFGVKIQQQSAALTLYMLLSIVPICALGFGVAKGFGYDKYLKQELQSSLTNKIETVKKKSSIESTSNVNLYEGYKLILDNTINIADSMLAKTKGGLVAGIGILLLFWTVFRVFANMESSFNDIWNIKKSRNIARKFSDYLSMMIVSPLLIFSASAINVYIISILAHMSQKMAMVNYITPLVVSVLNLLPYVLIYILFTIVYLVMPNTKVNFKSAVMGGIIGGSVFQLVQIAYIHFQIGVSTSNAIYGTFAAVPLFIIWMQTSWMIVLFGAKVAYATQNYFLFEYEQETKNISEYSRRLLALQVAHKIVVNFQNGNQPLGSKQLSNELKIPYLLIDSVLSDLQRCEIVLETTKGFVPAKNVDMLTVHYVNDKLDMLGENFVLKLNPEVSLKLDRIHQQFRMAIINHPENVLLKDL